MYTWVFILLLVLGFLLLVTWLAILVGFLVVRENEKLIRDLETGD